MNSEVQMVLDIIKQIGVSGLGNWDGCTCCDFSIRGVNVDINCGKGQPRGIWIYSRSMDYTKDWGYGDHDELLKPVAEEIKRQVEEYGGRGPIEYYFHPFEKTAVARET